MDDWIYLTYRVHQGLERMIVPSTTPPNPRWNKHWVVYAAVVLWRLYMKT